MHLSTLSLGGVQFRAIPKLACAEVFRDFADALLDVVPAEANGRPSAPIPRSATCTCGCSVL